MKILHTVESYYPEIGGMAEVVRQLSERLVKLGHKVEVATKKVPTRKNTTINGVRIHEFAVEGNIVRGMKGEVERYGEFILKTDADIVTNFAAQQWATDIALPILDKIKAKKVFVPTGFSGFYYKEYAQYFEDMKIWMKNYDANVFLSDDYRDINFARANGVTKNFLIPNGAAADEFLPDSRMDIRKELGIKPEDFLILHVGSYTTIKGQKEALEIFLGSELRNATILFIGFHNDHFKQYIRKSRRLAIRTLLARLRNKKVLITLLNREQTVAAYKEADLFLFPSNVECSPIVLFECMASQTPFLSTDVGNAKEIVKWSNGGTILPTTFDEKGYSHADIKSSISLLNDIYNNEQQRKNLGQQGFQAWQERFTWEKIALQYEKLYTELLN